MRTHPAKKLQTWLLDPVQEAHLQDFVQIKKYSRKEGVVIQIFQNIRTPAAVFYGLFSKGTFVNTSSQLELVGIPEEARTPQALQPFLSDTSAKVTEFSPTEYKLALSHRGQGGGWKEVAVGVGATAAGAGLALAAATVAMPAAAATAVTVGASAVIGGGVPVALTGWGRKEDKFDAELGKDALKGFIGGAATGLLGGGAGGALVRKVGAKTVFAKQSIHAVTNALGGIFKNFTEAKTDEYLGGKEGKKRAKEKMSKRSFAANALAGILGGLAGAHVGKQAAEKISNEVVKGVATSVGGMAAGGAAGAAGAAAGAVAVNACEGKELTEGLDSAAKDGVSTGMIIGAIAATRVSAKHTQMKKEELLKEQQQQSLNDQATHFEKTGMVKLDSAQQERTSSLLKNELQKLEKSLLEPNSGLDPASTLKQMEKLEGLLQKVQIGVLDKEALNQLNQLNGLHALGNTKLAGLFAAGGGAAAVLPTTSSQNREPTSVNKAEETTPEELKSPSPTKTPDREKISSQKAYPQRKKRSLLQPNQNRAKRTPWQQIQHDLEAIDRAVDGTSHDPLAREQRKINEKINYLKKKQRDPQHANHDGVRDTLNVLQQHKTLLRDVDEATSNAVAKSEQLEDGQVNSIIAGPRGEMDHIYKKGKTIRFISEEDAEALRNSGFLPPSISRQEVFDLDSELGREKLYEAVRDRFLSIQNETLQSPEEERLPSLQGSQDMPLPSFYPSEERRLEGILDLDMERVRELGRNADLLNARLSALLEESRSG